MDRRIVQVDRQPGLAFREAIRELRPLLGLAVPVVLAEIGWMAMGIVDTIMVGPLGAAAIGAVGLGSVLHGAVAITAMGLFLGLDTEVARSFGAGRLHDCQRWLLHGLYLALALSPIVMGIVAMGIPILRVAGLDPEILRLTIPYLGALNVGTLPLLLALAIRRYLQAMNLVRSITVALIGANVVNALANWVLVYGHWGVPALGVVGSGWSTSLARLAMMLVLFGAAWDHDRRSGSGFLRISFRLDLARLRRLVALGYPAAIQLALELGVFAMATALAGRFGPAALAAHQIALNAAGLMFMVPLGVASAGAVRVGQAIGRGDRPGAACAGWTALMVGGGFMACSALTFLLVPGVIIRAFTSDPAVESIGVVLLFIAAVFQLFDGLQGVATGILRGAGDTRTPMICNLIAHWALGLPIGCVLGFGYGWGIAGLWVGLSIGLIAAGLSLLIVWARAARGLLRAEK